jgi:uncharacterized protein YmfQ (DUF2313 family)
MAELPIVLTKQQQAQTFANYLPSGKIFGGKNVISTKIRKLLLGFATEVLRVDEVIKLFRRDTVPDTTENFIDEWEAALGIPDSCLTGTGTSVQRRIEFLIKLAGYGVQTAQDFIDLALRFGIVIGAEGGANRGIYGKEPTISFGSDKEARFTLVIAPIENIGEKFTYTFPITFGTKDLSTLECLFNKLKPANVQLFYENEI